MHLIRMQCGNRIVHGQVVKLPAPELTVALSVLVPFSALLLLVISVTVPALIFKTPFSFKRSRKGGTDISEHSHG